MRLLLVIDSLRAAGAQRQMVNTAVALTRRGHLVELFMYHPELADLRPELEAAGVTVHTYAKRRRIHPGVVIALGRTLAAGNYSGVLSFLTAPNLYAEIACAGRPHLPLVVSERNDFAPETPAALRWLARRLHARFARAVTTNSAAQRERIESACSSLTGRTHVVRNGFDLSVFAANLDEQRDTRSEPRLLALGSVSPRKNPAALIRALAQLRNANGDCPHVDWAGRRAEPAFSHADGLIRENGLTEHWQWLGHRTDVPALLGSADALIHPGLREGLSNAICEAFASGVPVLAADRFDHAELIGHGERGFLFDPERPESIASAISSFRELPTEERRAMGRRCRAFAEASFSLERLGEDYEKLFQTLENPA